MNENPRPEEEIAENITISGIDTGDVTFSVDPLGYVPPSHDHSELCAKMDEMNKKLDHLLLHAHQEYTVVPSKWQTTKTDEST
tara:strand:+ start:234 stop:482 length:249 start_codon:yes stop_codon:yes gene_type:complete